MATIGITGAGGMLGWHLRCHLLGNQDHEVVPIFREDFADLVRLGKLIGDCDVVVHMAGANRGDDSEIEETNTELAEEVVHSVERSRRCGHIVYTNSVQAGRDTPYGRSKERAAEIFQSWADRRGGAFTNLVLPHVFGEHGHPFYNSVVSTFCQQLAGGESATVHRDGSLELLHAQDVAALVVEAIDRSAPGLVRPAGRSMTVQNLLKQLESMSCEYRNGRIPDLRDLFALQLFNTYRSYLFPSQFPVTLEVRTDQRGDLFEAVKSLNGGQTFLSSTHPGIVRGNHYHLRKVERFLVIEGEGMIRLRRLFTNELVEFLVNGSRPQYVDMPTMHTHNITNVGSTPLVTLFWANEIFDPDNPDTVPEMV